MAGQLDICLRCWEIVEDDGECACTHKGEVPTRLTVCAAVERDQLLEAIEGAQRFLSAGPPGNPIRRLYELADQIKGSTQLDAQPKASTKAPETSASDSRLQEIRGLLEQISRARPTPGVSVKDTLAGCRHLADKALNQLQANEETGDE